jgi:hypothetical protein
MEPRNIAELIDDFKRNQEPTLGIAFIRMANYLCL